MKKAFTLAEIMIVVVIIGLLATMAIPAFQKVKINSIAREVAAGHTVTYKDMEYLKTNIVHVSSELLQRLPSDVTGTNVSVVPISAKHPQVIVINGRAYTLVPQ